jgi:hypothetical protein
MINLRGGSTNRGSGGIIFFVRQYWNHPLFGDPNNPRRLSFDISILQTQQDSPIQGLHVAPVLLPPNCASGNCCQICGGTTVSWHFKDFFGLVFEGCFFIFLDCW